MLADLNARDGRVDGLVIRAGLFLAVAAKLGIKRIDMRRAAAEPDENSGVSFPMHSLRRRGFSGHG